MRFVVAQSGQGYKPLSCSSRGYERVTVSSMTGFARSDGHDEGVSWVWEVKSVNSKSLDLRFRLPPGFESLEMPLRAGIAQRLKRGAVSVMLGLVKTGGSGGLRVNRDALAQVVTLAQELVAQGKASPPRADGLLALRGVLESGEEGEDEARRERRQAALLASFAAALQALAAMRAAEGERLIPVLETRLAEIAQLVATAEDSAAAQPQALKARLVETLAQLLDASPALPPDRLRARSGAARRQGRHPRGARPARPRISSRRRKCSPRAARWAGASIFSARSSTARPTRCARNRPISP